MSIRIFFVSLLINYSLSVLPLSNNDTTQDFSKTLYKLREEKKFTDITLISKEGDEFPAHSLMLVAQSNGFYALVGLGKYNQITMPYSNKAIQISLYFIYYPNKE